MTSRCRPALRAAVLAGVALSAFGALAALPSCGRTELPDACPLGFVADARGFCACQDDSVCPDGLGCVDGVCRCINDACCPPGHRFVASASVALGAGSSGTSSTARTSSSSSTSSTAPGGYCVCRADACCPPSTHFDPASGACVCTSDACCPPGHHFDAAKGDCVCESGHCCPDGYLPDPATGRCTCSADSCCPVDYRFDAASGACACAADSCCPDQHQYDPGSMACVCTGVGCCPSGFQPTSEGGCQCMKNDACPAGLTCDPASGRCICARNTDCGMDEFCNRFGFCQSLNGCASNLDCPADMFCWSAAQRCLTRGTCGEDAHCPIGSICDGGNCAAGCRTTGDCSLLEVCVGGVCQAGLCADNNYCAPREFCQAMTCGAPDPAYCAACNDPNCSGPCLMLIVEGDPNVTFCGMPCTGPADCPGDMRCDESYSGCDPANPACPAGMVCLSTIVLNQSGASFFCSDPTTMMPAITARYCSPRTGICP
jgi:hypothetical protein